MYETEESHMAAIVLLLLSSILGVAPNALPKPGPKVRRPVQVVAPVVTVEEHRLHG